MRDEWRGLLEPVGVVPETIFLATDRTTVLERVRDRQGDYSDDYLIPEDLAAQHIEHFEVPTPDEAPLTVIRQAPQPSVQGSGLSRSCHPIGIAQRTTA